MYTSQQNVITRIADCRGVLCPLEFDCLPFVPQRMFYVTHVPVGVVRGKHAHIKGEQIIICVKGRISLHLYNGLNEHSSFLLSDNDYIHIPNLTWNSYIFETSSVMLVLCSNKYDEHDYIRDIHEFKRIKETL